MRIKSNSLIEEMSGKLSKDENIVFSMRYGKIHAWRVNGYRGPFSPEQVEVQNDFAEASRKALEDMADPVKKAEWQAVAEASEGRWNTARGAAMASYMMQLGQE